MPENVTIGMRAINLAMQFTHAYKHIHTYIQTQVYSLFSHTDLINHSIEVEHYSYRQ